MNDELKDDLVKIGMARFFKTAAATGATGKASKWLMSDAGKHTTELAGLGALAVPSVAHLAGHDMDERNKHLMEVGGLGTLAAPSVATVLKGMRKR